MSVPESCALTSTWGGFYWKSYMNYPDPLVLPTNLNPHAIDQWFEACKNLNHTDPRSAWRTAIGTYTDLCRSAGLSPFVAPKNQNVAIRNFLYTRRRKIVRFLDVTKLMVGIPVIRKIDRSVQITPSGFKITVQSQVRIEDPTWVGKITKFALGYRFSTLRNKQRQYISRLDPSVTFFVYNDQIAASHQWHIGYTIQCPMKPEYIGGYSEKEFILGQLWAPLSHKFRPSGVNQILHV